MAFSSSRAARNASWSIEARAAMSRLDHAKPGRGASPLSIAPVSTFQPTSRNRPTSWPPVEWSTNVSHQAINAVVRPSLPHSVLSRAKTRSTLRQSFARAAWYASRASRTGLRLSSITTPPHGGWPGPARESDEDRPRRRLPSPHARPTPTAARPCPAARPRPAPPEGASGQRSRRGPATGTPRRCTPWCACRGGRRRRRGSPRRRRPPRRSRARRRRSPPRRRPPRRARGAWLRLGAAGRRSSGTRLRLGDHPVDVASTPALGERVDVDLRLLGGEHDGLLGDGHRRGQRVEPLRLGCLRQLRRGVLGRPPVLPGDVPHCRLPRLHDLRQLAGPVLLHDGVDLLGVLLLVRGQRLVLAGI